MLEIVRHLCVNKIGSLHLFQYGSNKEYLSTFMAQDDVIAHTALAWQMKFALGGG